MTTNVDPGTMPYLALRSTESRVRHFSQNYFKTDESSFIFRFVDAVCGDAGAGSLKKALFIQRLTAKLDTMYFGDLDNIFGNIGFFLSRFQSESYDYRPESQMLTPEQWDEVRVKDAWYRARIRDFFIACGLGGTADGFRMMVHAALGVDADLFEVWRYIDNIGITETMGRGESASLRNEVVVRPHKANLTPKEKYLTVQMLNKIRPQDTIVTVDEDGLGVHRPLAPRGIAASSSYFEVEKSVVGIPDVAKLPAPELLQADLDFTALWLKAGQAATAPTTAFNSTQEYSQYYYKSPNNDVISSVSYTSEDSSGTEKGETSYVEVRSIVDEWTPWTPFPLADSPDNYPGGQLGIHPLTAPALNYNGTPYVFPYNSQAEFEEAESQRVSDRGGEVRNSEFRLPVSSGRTIVRDIWSVELAIATKPPTRDTTIVSNWFRRSSNPLPKD